VDNTFNIGSGFPSPTPGYSFTIYDLKYDSNNQKIYCVGTFTTYNGTPTNYIVRINLDGTIDNTFNIGSGFSIIMGAIAIQSDGKILVGDLGWINASRTFTRTYNTTTQFANFIRLNYDGSVDNTFDAGLGFTEGTYRNQFNISYFNSSNVRTTYANILAYYSTSAFGPRIPIDVFQSYYNDNWHQVTITKGNDNTYRYYEDGALRWSNTIASDNNLRLQFQRISTRDNLSNLFLYDRVLNPIEILQNYQSQFPRFLGENIVTNGLVSYLDAGYNASYPKSGTTWFDLSGYVRNGTLTNGPTYSVDGSGCIVFDGIDDSVILGSFAGNFISNPSLNNGIISFSCWVYVSNSNSYYIISSGAQTNSTGVAFSYQNGIPFVSVKGQNFTAEIIIGAVNFPLNTWINFTFVANGNTLITYKNGVLLQSTNYVSATWSDTATLLTIARPNNTTSFTLGGKVAITSFYSIALSSDEVLQNFNAQKSRFGL
jgi:hypothetical protein